VRTADAWAALADPTRRGILARVVRQPSSVTVLASGLPVSRPAVSQHLQVLLEARLVDVHQRGRQRIYTARLDGLEALRRELGAFWSQALANLKRFAEESYHHTEECP
jgi:DNA-binding transcriptional ArsR family regulator